MKLEETKEVLNIIKNEPLSMLIIFSLLILPVIFWEWRNFFPEFKLWVMVGLVALWAFALFRLREELLIYRRKIILLNLLRKEKRHSIDYLSQEWIGKDEFTAAAIHELVKTYPEVFKWVKIGSGDNYKDGVGLVEQSNENSGN